jgi:hypothetical protein
MSKSTDDIWKDYIDNEIKINAQHKVEQILTFIIQDREFWANGVCGKADEEMIKLGFTPRQSGDVQYQLMNVAKKMYDKLIKMQKGKLK